MLVIMVVIMSKLVFIEFIGDNFIVSLALNPDIFSNRLLEYNVTRWVRRFYIFVVTNSYMKINTIPNCFPVNRSHWERSGDRVMLASRHKTLNLPDSGWVLIFFSSSVTTSVYTIINYHF